VAAKKTAILPFFAVFWTSAFSDFANCHQYQKVEDECTTTNLPLSNGIKIVSVHQPLRGEIGRTNSDIGATYRPCGAKNLKIGL